MAMDRHDRKAFREVFNASTPLQTLIHQGAATLSTFGQLAQDVFTGLHRPVPELLPNEAVRPAARVHRRLLSKVMETTSWLTLREATVLDQGAATVALLAILQALLEDLQANPRLATAMQKTSEAAAASMLAQLRERCADTAGAEQAAALAEKLAHEAISLMDEDLAATEKAVGDGGRAVQEATGAWAAWGAGHGERQMLPIAKQLELLKAVTTPEFRWLTVMVGRDRDMIRGKLALRARRQGGGIQGVTLGRSLERALPVERARLAHPLGRYDMARRMAEGRLAEYDVRYRPRQGKGPMIVLIDTSKTTLREVSQEGEGSYRVRDWIRRVAHALHETASVERRTAAFIPFDDEAPHVIEFGPGENDPEKLYTVCATWYGGGTNFQKPLQKAIQLLEGRVYRDADIVLITDGAWNAWDEVWLREFHRQKSRLGFRVIAAVIQPGSTAGVIPVSDRIVHLQPNGEGLTRIIEATANGRDTVYQHGGCN